MEEKGHWGRMLWAYHAVFTQAAAGGGAIRVLVTMQERTEILFGQIGPDNYAAARAASCVIQDGTSSIAKVVDSISLDNQTLPIPASGEGAAVDTNAVNEFEKRIILGRGDVLKFDVAATVQNETLTIVLRGLISTSKPVITTTGSGGTVTVATTYNKVI